MKSSNEESSFYVIKVQNGSTEVTLKLKGHRDLIIPLVLGELVGKAYDMFVEFYDMDPTKITIEQEHY